MHKNEKYQFNIWKEYSRNSGLSVLHNKNRFRKFLSTETIADVTIEYVEEKKKTACVCIQTWVCVPCVFVTIKIL